MVYVFLHAARIYLFLGAGAPSMSTDRPPLPPSPYKLDLDLFRGVMERGIDPMVALLSSLEVVRPEAAADFNPDEDDRRHQFLQVCQEAILPGSTR